MSQMNKMDMTNCYRREAWTSFPLMLFLEKINHFLSTRKLFMKEMIEYYVCTIDADREVAKSFGAFLINHFKYLSNKFDQKMHFFQSKFNRKW